MCSGFEMPKPTTSGTLTCARTRRKNAGSSSGRRSLAPVTPATLTQYTKPEARLATSEIRRSEDVGASR